ncbi:MAG: UDP-N-acetylmuramoyl-L-alanine--D-glutamate ligase [Chloroflexi bacterium]|nr:UDP-N-acetylmuramoyl-L-alanine--D-glutamate ligase [Chloroflexota bacterium]
MDWEGRRVVIVGAARQGTALAAYLVAHGARVLLTDMRPAGQLRAAQQRLSGLPVEWQLAGHPLEILDEVDLLCLSGGVPNDIPLVAEAQKLGIQVSNDSQIFLELAPCPVIGITGSAGKTTTTTLVGRILKAMEGNRIRRAWVGGNIGNPLIGSGDEMQATDLAVIELSSFQLEWMTRSPHVAAVLNIAPNHLDRHHTMEKYVAAKLRILDYQAEEDIAVLNRDDEATWALSAHVKGTLWSFGRESLPLGELGSFVRGDGIWLRNETNEKTVFPLSLIELIGEHNLQNILAACAIAGAVGASDEAMRAGVRGFRGAPHRLEWVRKVNGADWVNDSIATAPQRTEAALRSFKRPIVLLLGGRDKGLPWESLAELAKHRVHHVVVFGEAAEMVSSVFQRKAPKLPVTIATNLAEAVADAAKAAKPGDVVLLSPGGTSFDEFVDFEERGGHFRYLVSQL